tara:strand:- start:1205 stop:1696 length:492 start_codon:yes stop_codon:yes gene_type:complete
MGFLMLKKKQMQLLERELQQLIMETPNEKLRERGLEIYGKKRSEVVIGNYGRADIIASNIHRVKGKAIFNLTLFELKKAAIRMDALAQACRYKRGIESYMSKRFPESEVLVQIVLIGTELSDDMLWTQSCSYFDCYKCLYDYEGIKFEHASDIVLINEGFGHE